MSKPAEQKNGDDGEGPRLQITISLNADGCIAIAGMQDIGSFLMLLELARLEITSRVTSARLAQELAKGEAERRIIVPDGVRTH